MLPTHLPSAELAADLAVPEAWIRLAAAVGLVRLRWQPPALGERRRLVFSVGDVKKCLADPSEVIERAALRYGFRPPKHWPKRLLARCSPPRLRPGKPRATGGGADDA